MHSGNHISCTLEHFFKRANSYVFEYGCTRRGQPKHYANGRIHFFGELCKRMRFKKKQFILNIFNATNWVTLFQNRTRANEK